VNAPGVPARMGAVSGNGLGSAARPVTKNARRRPARRPVKALAIGMLVILSALGYLIYQGLSSNLVYYITPSELMAKGASAEGQQLSLGGQVRPGSQHWNSSTKVLTFVLQDPRAHVSVVSDGTPPAMFASGIGVVVQGMFRNGRFSASTLMVKHSSDYVAPKPGQLPKPDNFANK
jgi:cytochrome c-type biogenesis protein CcmE